jgi:hypothetical protein
MLMVHFVPRETLMRRAPRKRYDPSQLRFREPYPVDFLSESHDRL